MKRLSFLFLSLLASYACESQTIVWSKLFDIHSENSLGGLSKNTVRDSNNNIITAVVETDLLKIYQLSPEGNIIASVNTNRTCGKFSAIQKVNDTSYALLYDNTPLAISPCYKLLYFDNSLGSIQEISINIPISTFFTVSSFFIEGGIFYISGFTNTAYIIYTLNQNDELILKHTSSINNAYKETIRILQNGNLLVDFEEGFNYTIRCISVEDGHLIWEKNDINGSIDTFQLSYKTSFGDNQNVYFAGLERTWVSGVAVDVFKLKSIDSNTGNIIQESTFALTDSGTSKIDDFKFNPVNNHLLLSYNNAFPDENVALLDFDADFNLIHQISIPYQYDPLGDFGKSEITVRDNGDMVFTYTSYKNDLENGNLYVANLSSDLNIRGTLELNIEPKNGSELFSHIQFYNDSNVIVTGYIPNQEPSISLEEVQYYLAMIDVDHLLAVDNHIINPEFAITPNPTQSLIHIKSSKGDINFHLSLYDHLGKKVAEEINANTINLQNVASGIYFLRTQSKDGNCETHKIIKQ